MSPIRRPFSLPYPDQVGMLGSLLRSDASQRAPDPRRLVTAAVAHGVAAHVLDACGRGRIVLSAELRSALAHARARQALHGQLLRREMRAVAPVVAAACGVTPLLVKGAALDGLRRDPRWRPFSDLDLLVPRGALAAAGEALAALGYARGPEPWAKYGERHGHEIALTRHLGAHMLSCELHWRISDDRAANGLDHERLTIGASPVDTVDRGLLRPSDAAHLLILALHLLHEPVKRLIWIEDVELLALALSADEWKAGFVLADELGLSWVLHRGLDYAARHLGLRRARPLPAGPTPPWGPLRAGERLDGWVGFQAGRVASPGWLRSGSYLRSAAQARWQRPR